jgi:hypothetical protein
LADKVTFEVTTLVQPKDDKLTPMLSDIALDWSSLKSDTAASVVKVDHLKGRVAFRNKLICKALMGVGIIVAITYGLVILI